jgi:hypothetical protein
MSNVVKMKPEPTHKFATLRDQAIWFEMNGFLFATTVDKIDEVLPNDIQRYCVNHVLYMLDMHRQNHIDEDALEMNIISMHNTATIEGVRILISVKLTEEEKYPDYVRKGVTGTAWAIHSNANQDEESIKNITYLNSRNIKDFTDCEG